MESETPTIAYVIRDAVFEEPFEVLQSANAWWMERTKVERLIGSLKDYLTLKQAMISAGISERQYRYFYQRHPKFCQVKDRCRQVLPMLAKSTIYKEVGKNWKAAAWFLERVEPQEYARKATQDERNFEHESVMEQVERAFLDSNGELKMNESVRTYLDGKRQRNDEK